MVDIYLNGMLCPDRSYLP